MKSMIKILAMTLFLTTSFVFGQIDNSQIISKTGTTAANFLKIAPDARGAGMGNAFIAVPGDISSMFWNPAGLDYLNQSEVVFVQSKWIADMDYSFAAFAMKLPGVGTIGFMAQRLSVGEDLVRTETRPHGTGELWDAQDMAISASISRRLTDRFSIGGNAKFISQRIWHEQANTMALDFGSLFIMPFNDIRLAAVLTNYGGKLQMTGRDLYFSNDPDVNSNGTVQFVNSEYQTGRFPLPMTFRVGLSGELMDNTMVKWTWAIDAQHPNDNLESVNMGTEIGIMETMYLRAGYSNLFLDTAEDGLTLGAGINYRIWGSSSILKVDYAYSDYGRLKDVQRFALGITF
jgi:hypothetical protein